MKLDYSTRLQCTNANDRVHGTIPSPHPEKRVTQSHMDLKIRKARKGRFLSKVDIILNKDDKMILTTNTLFSPPNHPIIVQNFYPVGKRRKKVKEREENVIV